MRHETFVVMPFIEPDNESYHVYTAAMAETIHRAIKCGHHVDFRGQAGEVEDALLGGFTSNDWEKYL